MPLIRLTVTPKALAARRANAKKSTGPRTAEGKRRCLLNALKHGRRSRHFRQTLVKAGVADLGIRRYGFILEQITLTFQPRNLREKRRAELLARAVWCKLRWTFDQHRRARRREAEERRTELPSPLNAPVRTYSVLSPIRISDPLSGWRLSFWAHRPRGASWWARGLAALAATDPEKARRLAEAEQDYLRERRRLRQVMRDWVEGRVEPPAEVAEAVREARAMQGLDLATGRPLAGAWPSRAARRTRPPGARRNLLGRKRHRPENAGFYCWRWCTK